MRMAESEEEDYMSDSFLIESKDTKGNQLSWGKTARKNKMEAKKQEADEKNKSKFKPVKVREEEQRQKGLNSAISTESKGFAMLKKMGYKQGSGLGKTGSGRAEPVGIQIKTGRGGLGQETELKRKQEEMSRMREMMVQKRAKMEVHHRGKFVQQMSDKFLEREVEKDLYNSQKACAHLDQADGYSEPVVAWYWPSKSLDLSAQEESDEKVTDEENARWEEEKEEDEEQEEEEEEEDELSAAEKLNELTNYLRTEHRYCVWCGTTFTDEKDLEENCPGNNADVHR